MKKIPSIYLVILVMTFLGFSCQQEDLIEKTITIDEVKFYYDQISNSNPNGRVESIEIAWNEGSYREISLGDAIEFPIEKRANHFVKVRDYETLYPLENVTSALAYKTSDEGIHLDYVQRIPTANTEYFTGIVTVNEWNGEVKNVFRYDNGQLAESESIGRSEDIDCFWIDHEICTTLTGGGEVYLGNCSIVSSYYHCAYSDSPSGLQSDDLNPNGGGGGNGSNGNLCPHPAIPGAFVECGTCLWLDENGNCTTQNPYKLCASTIGFVQVGAGYTAEIVGLGASAYHKSSNTMLNAEFGNTCVSISARNQYVAADLFAAAYDNARNELAIWINTQPITSLNSTTIQLELVHLLNQWLLTIGSFSRGKCQGNVPISTAGYDTNC